MLNIPLSPDGDNVAHIYSQQMYTFSHAPQVSKKIHHISYTPYHQPSEGLTQIDQKSHGKYEVAETDPGVAVSQNSFIRLVHNGDVDKVSLEIVESVHGYRQHAEHGQRRHDQEEPLKPMKAYGVTELQLLSISIITVAHDLYENHIQLLLNYSKRVPYRYFINPRHMYSEVRKSTKQGDIPTRSTL